MSKSSKAHLFNDSKLLACLTQTALCECMKADSCKRATTELKLYIPSTKSTCSENTFGQIKLACFWQISLHIK